MSWLISCLILPCSFLVFFFSVLYSILITWLGEERAGLILRPSQGFWGTGEQGHLFSGEQGNKGLKISGTGEHRQFWGTGNIENQDFVFWGTRKQGHFFSREQGNRYPPPLPREGLNILLVHLFVYLVCVSFCLFSVPLGVRAGWLRLVIVAINFCRIHTRR